MISILKSIVTTGFNGQLINIEGDITKGLPAFNLVGLASKTITEARVRVRSAIRSSGFTFPAEKLTINLAPAEIAKDGPHLDLPIALSVLILSKQLNQTNIPKDSIFLGELSLEGTVRPVRGIISLVENARALGFKNAFVPLENYHQARLIADIKVIPVSSLSELFLHLTGQKIITPPRQTLNKRQILENTPTFDDIADQPLGKRALQIAIAGHHNLLMTGPPGTGKSLLGKAALSLLPPLSLSEQIILTKLYSLTNFTTDLITSRPFRTPHHSASLAAILGGGNHLIPGEVSLAHLGILFLDEIPEFHRDVLESLRQPLEDRQVSVSRVNQKATYPADFMLIATINPCPCGYLGDPNHPCTCTDAEISRYQKKISGPLLDRIDLVVNIARIDPSSLLENTKQKFSTTNVVKNTETDRQPLTQSVVKNTILEAIQMQRQRYGDTTISNASLPTSQISQKIPLSASAKSLLDEAAKRLDLSARSYFKTIKVARTIADLTKEPIILPEHISEALTFRPRPIKRY